MEVNFGGTQLPPIRAYPAGHARAQALRHLLTGFIVILVLLGLDGFVGAFGERVVRDGLADLRTEELESHANIGDLQKSQALLQSVERSLLKGPETQNGASHEEALSEVQRLLSDISRRLPSSDPDEDTSRELESASDALRHARDAVGGTPGRTSILNALEAISLVSENLTQSNYSRAKMTRLRIEDASWRQSVEDRVLLAGCLLVSSLFLLASTRVYYRMTVQSEELSQVSWQLLEKQELLAQRLSRELHDELGQSLTALKTNFSRHAAADCVDPSWMQDCNDLLKGSIRSAHEISELLRPTLLDDFGLDSALLWLCERFEERNGIKVQYHSDYHWRLDEQAETHVFRIAQEALTNVARHSKATAVDVLFSKENGVVKLKIRDNGGGIQPRAPGDRPSFGLTGMRARARSLEGEMRIDNQKGSGVSIEVSFPAKDSQAKTGA